MAFGFSVVLCKIRVNHWFSPMTLLQNVAMPKKIDHKIESIMA